MTQTIYKICTAGHWTRARQAGQFDGAAVDLADGFIHFSAAHQVVTTAEKHFAGQSDLLLLAVDAALLGDALRWEVSRGGDLFPHLYGALPLAAVTHVWPLSLTDNGRHRFPDEFLSGGRDPGGPSTL